MEQLKEGQEVVFTIKDKIYKYKVCSCYLNSTDLDYNSQIFIDLGLKEFKFCSEAYGYEAFQGDWPEAGPNDYHALTCAVEALFSYCNEVTVDGNIVYSKSEKTIFKEPESSISSSNPESLINIDFESIVQKPKIKLTFI